MKFCLVFLLFFSVSCLFGQGGTFGVSGLDMNTNQGGFVTELKSAEKKSVGSAYLFDDYRPARIVFLNDTEIELPVNLNILNGTIEIYHNDQIKIGSDKIIKYVVVRSGISTEIFGYENLVLEGTDFSGLAKKVYDGASFKVLKLFSFYVKEGYYVPALDVGDDKVNYVIKETYVVTDLDGTKDFKLSTNSKRKFSKCFKKEDLILSYIKDNNLDLGNENDLNSVFEFIDLNL